MKPFSTHNSLPILQLIKIVFPLLLIFSANARSQPNNIDYNGSYFINHYDINDYQSSAQAWSATSDNRNLMFFGTNKHLLVYDGVSWKQYQARNKSILRSLAVDSNNIVYAGSYNEFGAFMPDTSGGYRYKSISKKLNDSVPKFKDIWQTYATTHGIYFIARKTVFRYHNNRLTKIPANLAALFAFKIDDIIWLIDNKKGLIKLKNGKTRIMPNFKKLIRSERPLINIIDAGKNKLRIITKSNGLFFYNTRTHKLTKAPVSKTVQAYLDHNELYTSTKIDQSRIAIGTLRGGIIIINEKGALQRIVNKSTGLKTGSIYALYADKFHNLWVMGANGIDQVYTSYPIHKYGEELGISDYVLDVIQHNGTTYICTLNGLFYLKNFRVNTNNTQKNIIRIDGITSTFWGFTVINDQLFGRSAKGLFHIKNKHAKNLLPGKFIFSLMYSKEYPEKLFLGLKSGLAFADLKFTDEKPQISNYKLIEEVTSRIIKIEETKQGDIWLGSHVEGLQKLSFQNRNLSSPKLTYYGEADGLPRNNNNISPIQIDNQLIFATTKGLYTLNSNPKNQKNLFLPDTLFTPYIPNNQSNVNGIAQINDTSYIINRDNLGILYKSKNAVAYTEAPFTRIRNKITHIRHNKALNVFNICTSNAFYIYDLNKKEYFRQPFQPLLRQVAIGNDSIIFNGNYTTFQNLNKIHIKQTSDFKPIISYKNNNITIDYAAVFYAAPDKTRYQYMIEGFDEKYSKWTSKTQVNYTNIPAGDYIFKLKAKNVYGATSKTTKFKFTITPPWHQTIWAYLAYGLFAVLFLIAVVRTYTYALKKQNKRLDAMVKARTAELREKNEQVIMQRDEIEQQKEEIMVQKDELEIHKNHLERLVEKRTKALKKAKERAEESDNLKSAFLANMSHEIRTPMNAIVGYADLLTEEDDKAQQEHCMTMISTNVDNLLQLIENIIDLSHLETNQIQPDIETINPETIIHKVYRNYIEKIKEKELKLSINRDSAEEITINTDISRAEQILTQLVDNAMKYTPKGQIIIGIEKNNTNYPNFILFYVKDTGVGMSKEEISLVFKRFTKIERNKQKLYRGTGIGLALCQKLVHLLEGQIWLESEKNKGTTLYFTLPKN